VLDTDTDIQDVVDPDVDPDAGDIYPDIESDMGGTNPHVNPSADIHRNTGTFMYMFTHVYKPYK
jgi:hypothetical protein